MEVNLILHHSRKNYKTGCRSIQKNTRRQNPCWTRARKRV